MKLKDLKRGMRCTRRDGKTFVVEEVATDNGTVFHRGELNFSYLSDDLISRMDKRDGDIMIVEDITVDGFKVIWKRPVKKYYIYVKLYYFGGLYDEGHLVNLTDDSIKMFNSRGSAEMTMDDIIENLRDGYKVEYEIKEDIK